MPLWAQIVDDLRSRIVAHEFETRFPTDEELVRDYEVSRQTVREAVRQLEQSGMVERQRGRGSFLKHPSLLEKSLVGFHSLAQSIRQTGMEERSVILSRAPVFDSGAAEKLGLSLDRATFLLERLRIAGDEPLALDRSWLPLEARSTRPLQPKGICA